MESSGQSDAPKCAHITEPPHVYKTFRTSEDYSDSEARIFRSIIRNSHIHSYIYPSRLPELPSPISFALPRRSIESVHRIILETDYNRPSWDLTFPHYISPSPNHSAHIPIIRRILASGHCSAKFPGCFVVTESGGFGSGDIVVLGGHGSREVVVENIEEVGRYYLLYAVREVGFLPLNSPMTTHLVMPLSCYRPSYFRCIARIFLACLPCCFGSLADFGDFGEGSEGEGVSEGSSEELEMRQVDVILGLHSELSESRFSDSYSEHGDV
jgi:hypothetical protein